MTNKIKIDNIDCDLFLKNFSKFKNQLSNNNHCNIEKCNNEDAVFFKRPIELNLALFKKCKLNKEIYETTDLYPVNICIVDFLLKYNILKDNFKLLDFGCGIPNLLYHLHLIGFKELYGYDNWKQVNKEYTDEFIANTGLNNIITNLDEIQSKNITALSHVGCAIPKSEYEKLLSIPTLEYIFADYRFTPTPMLPIEFNGLTPFEDKIMIVNGKYEKVPESLIREFGFEPFIIYDGLLLIYKKPIK